jgi:uncharacterized protein (TIGR04255 family)
LQLRNWLVCAKDVLIMSRKYKNPPLIEAVCEFQFDSKSEWDIAIPGLLYERLRKTFPIREQVPNEIEFTMTATAEAGIEPQLHTVSERIRFFREDKKALVQVGPHVLSIHHVKPYPTWEEYLPLIQRVFGVYLTVAQPQGLRRIGLRYINKLEIPGSKIFLENYVQFYPYMGPDFPEEAGPFIVGVQFAYDDRDTLRVQMASAADHRADRLGMILDLHYWVMGSQHIKLDAATEWLQVAHDRIEQIFEACLTDELRIIFEEESE